MEYNVNLSNRNKKVYDLVDNKLITDDSCALVSAPGTGKSFISMELISRNKDKDILYLAPTKAILNQYKRHMAEEGLLGDVNPDDMEEVNRRLKIYYPKLQLHTYSWFHLHQTNGDLDNENYDYVICDEYHHTGGDKWYLSFNDFKSKHKNTKYFGMSATPQRMDGQATMFSYDNDVVYEYSLAEAIVDGELDVPIYVDCGIRYMGEILKSRQTIIDEFPEGKDKQELLREINSFIHNINSYGGLSDVFSKYIPDNSKVLYFCPPSNIIDKKNNTKAIYEAYNNRDKMFGNINSDIRYYMSFGEYKDSEKEEEAFINDNELGIKVLYTVNKYSEGVHSENTNVLVMERGTFSVSLFTQQLGRGLVAGKNNGERVIVLDLVGNIHIYQEIVEEVRRVVDKRISEGISLPGGVSKEEFMSKFKIHDLELGQKEFLDNLKGLIRDNRNMYYRDNILSWVNKIEEYCKNNGEWPKNKIKDKYVSKFDLITSDKLAKWLKNSGYNVGDFKYIYIKDERGELIINRLNYLYKKYRDEVRWVNKIEEYCKNNGEWPKQDIKDKYVSKSDLTSSDQLAQWLAHLGYNKGKFKYKDIEDENGNLIIDRINYLHAKYRDEVKLVNKIEEYCKNNGEWPKGAIKDKYVSKSDLTTSHQLARWLIYSGYNKEKFKYSDIKDENGVSIYDRLNELYSIFSSSNRTINKMDEYDKNYNLRVASKSDDYVFRLYYFVIELMNSYYDKDTSKFNKYIGMIDNIIRDNNIDMDIEEIVSSFDLSSDEMVEYYLEGYTSNSIQNNVDKALLYKRLYNYVVVLNKGINRMR